MTAARPDALLLLTSSCPYCPTVLQGLSELVKSGLIGRLEVVNIGVRPEIAQQHGVRSVPWVKLGPFELEGLQSPAELKQWAERATRPDGLAEYFRELLKDGQLARVTAYLGREPAAVGDLLKLLADPDVELTVRIGISAVFEEMEGDAALHGAFDALTGLSLHQDAHIRADAAHLLSLTHRPDAVPHLEHLLGDKIEDVVEIAREGLERLRGKKGN
jgi:hypothetical protein